MLSAECGITHEQICNWYVAACPANFSNCHRAQHSLRAFECRVCVFRFVNARMRYTKKFGAKGGKRAAASSKEVSM